jgi:integrase
MASRSTAKHIYKKRGIYYFQRSVPKHLLRFYRTDRVVVSLKTRQQPVAIARSKALATKLDDYWYQLLFHERQAPLERFLVGGATHDTPDLKLQDVADLYRERRGANRGKRFHQEIDRAFRYLKSAAGDRLLETYSRQDALRLRDYLKAKGLAPQSMDRTTSAIRSAFNLAIREHGLEISNVFAGVDYGDHRIVRTRRPFDTANLAEIQSECRRVDDEARWLIALISDTGMRLAEAIGLAIDDIHVAREIPYVDLKPHPWRSLKTAGSRRKIPLVGQSLWAASRVVEHAHGSAAFPSYNNGNSCKADNASAALNKWLKARVKQEGVVIHSFRHSLRDRLRAIECPGDVIDQIGGWKTAGVGQSYGNGYSLEVLYKWMQWMVNQDA